MNYIRERPRCRQLILRILEDEDLTLEELLNHKTIFLSDDLKMQGKKMFREGQFVTGLELYKQMQNEKILRTVGAIR